MAKNRQKPRDPKAESLQEQDSLNPKPEDVSDPAFQDDEFFDPRDLVQVKYEMVRRVRTEGRTVTEATRAFGFSRPTFYVAQAALKQEGLPGLVPKKRGPHGGHKISAEVLAFIQEERAKDPSLGPTELLKLVEQQFSLTVHRSTMDRALDRLKKKRR
ncbi:MAG: helix-turn-helix domain containing protein [Armatimonadetes bacterium]|nr:helix-turn-helix domain containing protein [Armatimonadota bacterium]